MFVTPLNIEQVLDRFYHQDKYELMLLFVSSFDGNDRTIIREIVDNAKRIDRITGDRVCFFYFIKDAYGSMNESLVKWVKNISNLEPLYGEGVSVTMETADDICRHFGILRSNLPAFILVSKDKGEDPNIFSIYDYNDFESFLTPLNILHSYIEDRDNIVFRYESKKQRIISEYNAKRRRTVVTQYDVDKRKADRISWEQEISRLINRKEIELSRGETDRANKRDIEIEQYKKKLDDYQELVVCGMDESVPYPQKELDDLYYPQDELDDIRSKTINRLNITLNSDDCERIIEPLQNHYKYSDAVLNIWKLVRTRGVRISNILKKIRYEIFERGFDVFISCKSQDYAFAHELYDFLSYNGFKPFLADTSIKEVGISQYTALIGEVINVCQNMVVFATDINYLETPYVEAEWHTFINDINTGHKSNAKIVNILSPVIDIHMLPTWLRDKQCFTTENYKGNLLQFLNDWDRNLVEQLRDKILNAVSRYRHEFRRLIRQEYWNDKTEDFFYQIEQDREYVERLLKRCEMMQDSSAIERLRAETESMMMRWESYFYQIVKVIEHNREKEEWTWHDATQICSEDEFIRYLKFYPQGLHREEACAYLENLHDRANIKNMNERKNKKESKNYVSFSPLFHQACLGQSRSSGSYTYSNIWDKLFNRKTYEVYSSIFAPAEVKRKSDMQVQVYLHLYEESDKVKSLAKESDKNADRRDYIPLSLKLKKGNKVDIEVNVYGERRLMSERKSVIWQGRFTKCSFGYFVPNDIDIEELSCEANIFVNGAMIGEMRFITQIVETPRNLNPEILSHRFNRIFISYAHQDAQQIKLLALAYKAQGVDYFYDRDSLAIGDVYEEKIFDYIDNSDLFVLCWSKNAAASDYVAKEKGRALLRAYPQLSLKDAKLKICPISIEPRADLPSDMKEVYNFEVI